MQNLTESTDVHLLARQMVAQCDLIAPSRVPELEQILLYLQSRKNESGRLEGDLLAVVVLLQYAYIFLQMVICCKVHLMIS